MASVIKKAVFVVLIFIGALVGYWLARENQKYFEVPYRQELPRKDVQGHLAGAKNLVVGMDTWQVKELLGPPEKRTVLSDTGNATKEEWTYGSKSLFFNNGFLAGWKD